MFGTTYYCESVFKYKLHKEQASRLLTNETLNHCLWLAITRPVTRRRRRNEAPLQNFSAPLKNMLDIVWNYWTWFKNLSPSQKSLLPLCPKLVTGLAITTLEQKFKKLARSRTCHFSNQHKNKKAYNFCLYLCPVTRFCTMYMLNCILFSFHVFVLEKSKTWNICMISWEWPEFFFVITGPLLEIIE